MMSAGSLSADTSTPSMPNSGMAGNSMPLQYRRAGVLVRQLGPSLFFPAAGAMIAAAVAGALSQHEFRYFGSAPPEAELDAAAA
jgi:hypothetical protein